MIRLFVAIALDAGPRDRLAALQSGLAGARWVAPENLHLTLRFIGHVPRAEAEDLALALEGVSAPGFQLLISGLGRFGNAKRTRAVWAGIEEPSGALRHLHDKVESALVRAGMAPDRHRFSPHITLARLKSGAQAGPYLAVHDGFQPIAQEVRAFTLFRSHLGGQGPHYETVAVYPLA